MINYFFLFLASLTLSLFIGNPLIKLLKSIGIKQSIREDGPKAHLEKKSKTPTIGGVIFLIPLFLLTIIFCLMKKDFLSIDLLVVLITTAVMAVLGFVDDYLKVLKKHNKGISGWTKLLVQLLVSIVFYKIYYGNNSLIYLLWCFFIIAGATNSFNLTDGLDGLLGSVSFLSFLGFFVLFSHYAKNEFLLFIVVFLGAIAGFLYFNKHPAKVFMGDTGSLAIGGAIGSLAIVSRHELYLALFATVPIIEAFSVIIQVLGYKGTKKIFGEGKRVFKMAPLHHHFELCGWKETKVVQNLFLFQLICTVIGIFLLFR